MVKGNRYSNVQPTAAVALNPKTEGRAANPVSLSQKQLRDSALAPNLLHMYGAN